MPRVPRAPRKEPIRRCAAGSIPRTGSGATRARSRPRARRRRCSSTPRSATPTAARSWSSSVSAPSWRSSPGWSSCSPPPRNARSRARRSDTDAAAPLTTLAGPQNAVPAAAQAAGHSMVELQVATGHGTAALIGVAVAEGGLVATTADLLGGVRRIVMVGPGGKAGTRHGRGDRPRLRHRAGRRTRGPAGGALRGRLQPERRLARPDAQLRARRWQGASRCTARPVR